MMKTGNSFSHAQLLHMLSQLTRDPEQSQEVCNVHQRQVVKKHDFSQICQMWCTHLVPPSSDPRRTFFPGDISFVSSASPSFFLFICPRNR